MKILAVTLSRTRDMLPPKRKEVSFKTLEVNKLSSRWFCSQRSAQGSLFLEIELTSGIGASVLPVAQ